jgi:hypothetical protein
LEININHYTILYEYVLRKNKYTWERGAGLGWIVAAYFLLFVQIFTATVSITVYWPEFVSVNINHDLIL